MSIVDRVSALERQSEAHDQKIALQDERMFGENGLAKQLGKLGEDVQSLRKAAWAVVFAIVVAAVGFGFAVLQLVHP